MARLILVTGGSRSGKSRHAVARAEALPGGRTYVATCPAGLDEEMDGRIRRHRREREGRGWQVVEAPQDLEGAIAGCGGDVVVVDCLTVWIGNLLHQGGGDRPDEDEVERRCRAVLAAAAARRGTVVFVTNEVGWGIVPDNPLARRFRDLAGRANQVIAAGADEVVLVACGLPLRLK